MDKQIKVLCVDDEINVLRALQRLFLDFDYEILTATSGKEGLEILKDTDMIQLVISDYRMPNMNGVDFLKEVCQNWPDTVRIVLSGYADTATIVSAINDGQVYKFIPKPWNDDELKISISKALEHYFIQQKYIELTKELETKNKELQEINNNLERLVDERTYSLTLQNQILTCSQNILDSLPVGVIGIDTDGSIVQCNRKGLEIADIKEGDILGMNRIESLNSEINTFIENVAERGSLSTFISTNGSSVKIKGVHMKYASGQEGIIIVFDETNADNR